MKTTTLAGGNAAEAPKRSYQVLARIHKGGTNYAPDREKVVLIELTEAEAAPLLNAGAIGPEPESTKGS